MRVFSLLSSDTARPNWLYGEMLLYHLKYSSSGLADDTSCWLDRH
jgi:hypothetical protein